MARWKIVEEKFKNYSRNITFEDAVTLLEHYGYVMDTKGKTSGSRIKFTCNGHGDILLHRPHPQKELKQYVVNHLHDIFEQEEFWNE